MTTTHDWNRRAGIVAADRCDRDTVGKINHSALHLGFALQLGVVLDDAFHSAKYPGQVCSRSLAQSFVRRLLSESPCQGQSTVERGLAALLDAAVKDCILRQAAILIEGKGESQHFALMVAKPEGLAQLVSLDQLIDEGYGMNDLGHTRSSSS